MLPNEEIAGWVVSSMTCEKTLSSTKLTTGDQYFVFAVKTTNAEYVIRMAESTHKHQFLSAIYWQEKLLPLGVPLAQFIQSDLECKHSQFPALLMIRLPGDDLCNVYLNLTSQDKKNLANEIVKIQSATEALPDGSGYGWAESYEKILKDRTWYDFLMNQLLLFIKFIKNRGTFDINEIEKVIFILKNLKENFHAIPARPFLWDASERNVLVYCRKISGIVDVDEICFGDPLFVIGLTYIALENLGYDTIYADYWAEALKLDEIAQLRLAFYRLYYAVAFIRKHSMTTTNNQIILYDMLRLKKMFYQSLARINEYINASSG